jgi:hypothetical protein
VDATDKDQGQTALMWAVAQKHAGHGAGAHPGSADVKAHSTAGSRRCCSRARRRCESGKALLAAGADVTEKGPNGMTPLLLASASGQEAFGIFLLDKGADPNARDDNGASALHYAVLKGITALNGVRFGELCRTPVRPERNRIGQGVCWRIRPSECANPKAGSDRRAAAMRH